MFKLIRKSEYDLLKKTALRCSKQDIMLEQLRQKLNAEQTCRENLKIKLKETGARIYAIMPNKNNIDTYICIIDNRNNDSIGELNMFVINSEIIPSKRAGKYNDMPFMETYFSPNQVSLIELHCIVNNKNYENKGYGTMMIKSLIQIARESKCHLISGTLYEGDAQTEEEKEKRNRFYFNRGFTTRFNDNSHRSGTFYMCIPTSK